MSVMYLRGGTPLEGELTVHGAKNSVLPILAACLLARGPVTLHNCPQLTDVTSALGILRQLGCRVEQKGHTITVDPVGAAGSSISEEQMRAMRSSIIFLGPLLARTGEAHLTYPGGCELGPRPIDLHLSAIRAMGCEVREDRGIHCQGKPLGGEVQLALPSVGATENAMLCAVGAAGPTTITNAAREPEIGDLQSFLNSLGANVRGAGSSTITVEGGRPLSGGEYTVMGDRIVAATLLSAAAAAGGRVRLRGVDWRHLATVLSVFHQAGCRVESRLEYVELARDRDTPLKGVPTVRTAPYPGFPTDAQAPVMAALAASQGCTLFVETMFDSRYRHVPELIRMGADITTEGRVALVRGVERLHGAKVEASDLRGGGALAAAALGAEGTTVLSGLNHIDRGYEGLEEMLRALGARVERREV
ncbi:MAG: UDP-N-acetylglucosamine 1-carboxyvinyltransferase [Clostridiales bacterium]|nr:UDP-N-acetylglucosamine 1-carboxyvinyltransferase [Clostridiales bacterium]